MSPLETIQEFLQRLAEVLSEVLSLDVAFVDCGFRALAGTGEFINEIGKVYSENTLTGRVLSTGVPVIVPNTRESDYCSNCDNRSSCLILASVGVPIKIDGKIEGCFALVSYNESQRGLLLRESEKFLRLMDKLSELISSAIKERNLTGQLTEMANQFHEVLDTVHEGIIAVNLDGKVTSANSSAASLLGVSLENLIGLYLDEIIVGFNLDLLNKGVEVLEEVVFQKKRGSSKQFLGTVRVIKNKLNKQFNGVVISFRPFDELRQRANHFFGDYGSIGFDEILGTSRVIQDLKEKMSRVAVTNSTILLRGETGTGKELFARAIHSASRRSSGPFVAINCGAIPESLLESELFGYEGGAFTGARHSGKPGKIELANNGTLFLDEVGDLPLHLQVKILRVLQERTIERVGGVRPIKVDVRVIAATHQDLELMIQRKEFREDLYYRLNVIPFFIPPLRERKEDIIVLLNTFLERYNAITNKSIKGYSPEALNKLLEYNWPGNVRELQNAVEYAVNMETGQKITLASLPPRIFEHDAHKQMDQNLALIHAKDPKQVVPLKVMEKEAIMRALKIFGDSEKGKSEVAKRLGIGRATLYRKLKLYGISRNSE